MQDAATTQALRTAAPRPVPPAWIQRIEEFVRQTAPESFSGKVELNFLQGGLTGTNVTQSYRR